MKRSYRTFLTLAVLALPSWAATDPDLQRPQAGQTAEVIVQYASQPTAQHHQRVTGRNGHELHTYDRVPVAHYTVTPEALADLENNKDVVSISPNRPVKSTDECSNYTGNFQPLSDYYINTLKRSKAYG